MTTWQHFAGDLGGFPSLPQSPIALSLTPSLTPSLVSSVWPPQGAHFENPAFQYPSVLDGAIAGCGHQVAPWLCCSTISAGAFPTSQQLSEKQVIYYRDPTRGWELGALLQILTSAHRELCLPYSRGGN